MIILGFVLAVGWRWHFKTMATRADFIEMTTRMDALRKQQIMPGNTVVMAAPGQQKQEKPSMLMADARPLRFDFTASVVPDHSVIESLPIVNAGSIITEANQIIKKYTSTPNWKDRLMYVHDPDRVKILMQDFYEVQHAVDPVMGALMDQARYRINNTEIVLMTYRSGRLEGKLEVALRKNEDGRLVLDWESYTGYSEKPFVELMKTKSSKPVLIRALVKLDDYYKFEFENSKEYISLKINAADSKEAIHAYCKRDSTLGNWIKEDLGDDPSSSLVKGYTLWVAYPPNAKSNDCLNLVQVAAGRWLIVPPKE